MIGCGEERGCERGEAVGTGEAVGRERLWEAPVKFTVRERSFPDSLRPTGPPDASIPTHRAAALLRTHLP